MAAVEAPLVGAVAPAARPMTLHRTIDWKGAFWVASGVPALVLFSIGGIAANCGNLAFAVWGLSVVIGMIQSFTYAELAGMFPHKSGGVSIYGASAFMRYSKFIGPISAWGTWLGWTPVISLGCTIAAAYLLNAFGPIPGADDPAVKAYITAHASTLTGNADAKTAAAIAALTPAFRTWTLFSHSLGPVSFSFNLTFFIGVVMMFGAFLIQHRGILQTARAQMWIGLTVIVPMTIVGVVPLFNGKVHWANFAQLVPLKAAGAADLGSWNDAGWTLIFAGLFIAGWSAYAMETAVSYTSEFRNPASDAPKAVIYSGLLCLALYILVPFTFQGVLGLSGMLAGPINDGSGVAAAMADMVGGGGLITGILVMLMILALILSIMTAMAGSSRTLYQSSVDGWFPKYLSHVNHHGAPTYAMFTDLSVNVVLLAIASADATSYFFILGISAVGYFVFNFINVLAGWLHRVDSPEVRRPYRAPTWLLALGIVCAYLNMLFMGAGAKVWNPLTLWAGLFTVALIIPLFLYRHYVQDKGKFPVELLEDLHLEGQAPTISLYGPKRAGIMPYVALGLGLIITLAANFAFHT